VGKILNTLDSLGLTENTIIILWGDHGWHLGDHDLWCKHTNFEQATRAPLLVSSPGIKPGKTKSLSEFVDIFPTLCELSGLSIPDFLDGTSLVPLMKNPSSSVKEYAVSQYPHSGKMGYSISTSQYRLTWWMQNGFRSGDPYNDTLIFERELYDYKKDPLETTNVVSDLKYKETVKEMNILMTTFFEDQAGKH
jgi:arylsulfatase A-like enzyme